MAPPSHQQETPIPSNFKKEASPHSSSVVEEYLWPMLEHNQNMVNNSKKYNRADFCCPERLLENKLLVSLTQIFPKRLSGQHLERINKMY